MPPNRRAHRLKLLVASLLVLVLAAFAVRWLTYDSWKIGQAQRALDQLDYERAIAILQPLHERRPTRADIAFWLACAYRRADQAEDFAKAAQAAQSLGWPSGDIERQVELFDLQHGAAGDIGSYDAFFTRELSRGQTIELYEALAKGFLAALRFQEAEFILDAWIALEPRQIEPRMMLADMLERLPNRARAQQQYQEILQIAPDHAPARYRLGDNHLQQRQFAAARQVFEALQRDEPQSVNAAYGRTMALVGLANEGGSEEEALAGLEQILALDLRPGARATALLERASIAFRNHRYDAALDDLQEAQKLSPSNPGVANLLGNVWRAKGDTATADEMFAHAKKLRDANQEFGQLLEDLPLHPTNVDMRMRAAQLAWELGGREDAVQLAASALLLDEQRPDAHEMLLKHYTEKGDREKILVHSQMLKKLREAARAASPEPADDQSQPQPVELDQPPVADLPKDAGSE